MTPIRIFLCCALPLAVSLLAQETPAPAAKGGSRPPNPLVWDAMEKSLVAKRGDTEVGFQFSVTNTGAQPVQILEVRTSCGCTVAELPPTPWVLEAGGKGSFRATVDIRGRHGHFAKT